MNLSTRTFALSLLLVASITADNTQPAQVPQKGAISITVPGLVNAPGVQSTVENTPLLFAVTTNNAIVLNGDEQAAVTLTIKAQHGEFILASLNGLDVTGEGTTNLVVKGLVSDINNALDGLVYMPLPNNTADTITFNVDQSGTISTSTITINIVAEAQKLIAPDRTFSTNQNTRLSVSAQDLLGDLSGSFKATISSTPIGGEVVLNQDGSFVYTPFTNFSGTDSFTYQIANDNQISNVATVTITVKGTGAAAQAADREESDESNISSTPSNDTSAVVNNANNDYESNNGAIVVPANNTVAQNNGLNLNPLTFTLHNPLPLQPLVNVPFSNVRSAISLAIYNKYRS